MDLSQPQFEDALSLSYGAEIAGLPSNCDDCGEVLMMNYALNYKEGGLVHHGYVRDECARLAKLARPEVSIELVPLDAAEGPSSVADIKIYGVWDSEKAAYFDVRMVNADPPSYRSLTWGHDFKKCYKHTKFDRAVEDLRGSHPPSGILHHEFASFLRRLQTMAMANTLADKWMKNLSRLMN